MTNIPDKCSRCGAPIDWEKGASSTKCDFCGKINYLKNDFFNSFINSINSKNTKKLLLNPISIFLIILLPVIFSRFIIQASKYKRFPNRYFADKACLEDEAKLKEKKLNVTCYSWKDDTTHLVKNNEEIINFKLSKELKKNIEKEFLKSNLNKSIKEINNKGFCNSDKIDVYDCLYTLLYNDLNKLNSLVSSSAAMKKCEKEANKQKKLLVSKHNWSKPSINCDHPTKRIGMNLHNHKKYGSYEYNKYQFLYTSDISTWRLWKDLDTFKKDIKLLIDIKRVKKYYLY